MVYLPVITKEILDTLKKDAEEIIEINDTDDPLIVWNDYTGVYEWTQLAVDFVSILEEK